jgi:hypothetical protein
MAAASEVSKGKAFAPRSVRLSSWMGPALLFCSTSRLAAGGGMQRSQRYGRWRELAQILSLATRQHWRWGWKHHGRVLLLSRAFGKVLNNGIRRALISKRRMHTIGIASLMVLL